MVVGVTRRDRAPRRAPLGHVPRTMRYTRHAPCTVDHRGSKRNVQNSGYEHKLIFARIFLFVRSSAAPLTIRCRPMRVLCTLSILVMALSAGVKRKERTSDELVSKCKLDGGAGFLCWCGAHCVGERGLRVHCGKRLHATHAGSYSHVYTCTLILGSSSYVCSACGLQMQSVAALESHQNGRIACAAGGDNEERPRPPPHGVDEEEPSPPPSPPPPPQGVDEGEAPPPPPPQGVVEEEEPPPPPPQQGVVEEDERGNLPTAVELPNGDGAAAKARIAAYDANVKDLRQIPTLYRYAVRQLRRAKALAQVSETGPHKGP